MVVRRRRRTATTTPLLHTLHICAVYKCTGGHDGGFLRLLGVCVCGSNYGNYKLTVVERVEDKNRDHGIQIRICKGFVAI